MFNNRENNANPAYIIRLEEVVSLQQSEEVSQEGVKALTDAIREEGVWTTIIPAEMTSGWVMDGNHRLNAAKYLGLKYVPVVRLSYNDPRVSVLRWDNDQPYPLDQVEREAQRGLMLPYKTTRHRFIPLLPHVSVPLDALRRHRMLSCGRYPL
ncbi:ParB N-terminal domain-containing protein [Pantoea vagans]|uniref:ParB N-terminal domain-containing protein n=1 Tax=Pantoea vagans TaxID=470934 RepID=UPI00301631B9